MGEKEILRKAQCDFNNENIQRDEFEENLLSNISSSILYNSILQTCLNATKYFKIEEEERETAI